MARWYHQYPQTIAELSRKLPPEGMTLTLLGPIFVEGKMMDTVKCKGSQGSWEADAHYPDGHVERLACAHQHWWKNGWYNDPWPAHLRKPEKKFSRYIDLLHSTGRVILTSDSINEQKFRGRFLHTHWICRDLRD
jgi:hypothetical protein